MANIYHATPYDISATGFYFSDYKDYQAKAATHTNRYGEPVEEYEIQFIDGDNFPLFDALSVNQATLETWFDQFEGLDEDAAAKVLYLSDYLGYTDIAEIIDSMDDVELFEGSAVEYVEQYIDDTGMLDSMPENLRYYFDTEAFARDMLLSGDITEVEIAGTSYVAWGG